MQPCIHDSSNWVTDYASGSNAEIGTQGWTRFSDFADLNALSEDEWDKVKSCLSQPPPE